MEKELKWRIVFGYGPSDYLSIGEAEIEKAIYAFKTGKIYKNIRGTEIKRIVPDFRFYTGWYDTYEPRDGEDRKQMERDMPSQMLFADREHEANVRVQLVIAKNSPSLLSDVKKVDQLLLA